MDSRIIFTWNSADIGRRSPDNTLDDSTLTTRIMPSTPGCVSSTLPSNQSNEGTCLP